MRIPPNKWLPFLLAALMLAPPAAFAVGMADFGTWLPGNSMNYAFGSINVQSDVYLFSGDNYLYTYQLFNNSNSQYASWFSVPILEGVEILSIGYDWSMVNLVPTNWHNVGSSPIISIDAQFLNPLAPGQTSTVLYFLSSHGPTTVSASIGGPVYTNLVNSPVPEPATMVLLAAGACMSLRRRLRK